MTSSEAVPFAYLSSAKISLLLSVLNYKLLINSKRYKKLIGDNAKGGLDLN